MSRLNLRPFFDPWTRLLLNTCVSAPRNIQPSILSGANIGLDEKYKASAEASFWLFELAFELIERRLDRWVDVDFFL